MKIERAVADLRRRGISAGAASPFLFRHLWRLGVPVPPPHFLTTGQAVGVSCATFVVVGVPLAALLGLADGTPRPWGVVILRMMFMGALFGVFTAERREAQARGLGLPSWEDYAPVDDAPSAVPPS